MLERQRKGCPGFSEGNTWAPFPIGKAT